MSRTELASIVSEKTGVSEKDCDKVLVSAMEAIVDAVRFGEKVQLLGFGTFEAKTRASRSGRNPRTGDMMIIPATRVPLFKPGKSFKDDVASMTGAPIIKD